jgi:hypothetical protein
MANVFFVLTNDEHNFFNAGGDSLFYGILCGGTVDNEQEFFWDGFGDGEKASTKASGRDYRFSHFLCHS